MLSPQSCVGREGPSYWCCHFDIFLFVFSFCVRATVISTLLISITFCCWYSFAVGDSPSFFALLFPWIRLLLQNFEHAVPTHYWHVQSLARRDCPPLHPPTLQICWTPRASSKGFHFYPMNPWTWAVLFHPSLWSFLAVFRSYPLASLDVHCAP